MAKTFSQLFQELQEYAIGDNPTVRSPDSIDFLNKHLVLKYKLSVPTSDENVFNAANITPRGGKRSADQVNKDDHTQGYHRPVMFGDYLNYLLAMRKEGVEFEGTDELLEEVDNLSDEEFDNLQEEEILLDEESFDQIFESLDDEVMVTIFAVNEDDELEQIDELSKATIKSYMKKNGESHFNASMGTLKMKRDVENGERMGHNMTNTKTALAKKEKTASKRLTGLKLASKRLNTEEAELEEANSPEQAKEKFKKHNSASLNLKYAAGLLGPRLAKERGVDHKAKRHGQAADAAKRIMTKEETELEEARRGRPRKNTEEEDHQEPILVQLRKHELLRGNKTIEFANGEKANVHPHHVKKALDMHTHLRTSIQKGDFQSKLAASHKSFKQAIGVHEETEIDEAKKEKKEKEYKKLSYDEFVAGRKIVDVKKEPKALIRSKKDMD